MNFKIAAKASILYVIQVTLPQAAERSVKAMINNGKLGMVHVFPKKKEKSHDQMMHMSTGSTLTSLP